MANEEILTNEVVNEEEMQEFDTFTYDLNGINGMGNRRRI